MASFILRVYGTLLSTISTYQSKLYLKFPEDLNMYFENQYDFGRTVEIDLRKDTFEQLKP